MQCCGLCRQPCHLCQHCCRVLGAVLPSTLTKPARLSAVDMEPYREFSEWKLIAVRIVWRNVYYNCCPGMYSGLHYETKDEQTPSTSPVYTGNATSRIRCSSTRSKSTARPRRISAVRSGAALLPVVVVVLE
eukprot:2662493-Rhodomonas_salina.2